MIQITDKYKCCGCEACAQKCPRQCIQMRTDKEGFWYPEVNKIECIDCGLCEKVCPIINSNEIKRPLKVYAAINPNEEIRQNSSSGGIFSLLAQYVLSEEGVVFGAKFNNKQEVIHGYCENVEELSAFRGSKYVQSRIGDSYKQAEAFLKVGRKVLFSGTSCQIAGLHKFLRKKYENLLTIDVVCHGVPSPLVWKKYYEEVLLKKVIKEKGLEQPIVSDMYISFRDKSNGWKKYNFLVKNAHDILYKECFRENPFMKIFLQNISLRPSCYACPAKLGKSGSDITLGDYWGIEHYYPEMDDDKGISLVMVYSSRGLEAFKRVNCNHQETTYMHAVKGNPCIEHAVQEPFFRSYFYLKFKEGKNINAINRTIKKMGPSLMVRIKYNINRLLFHYTK